MMQSSTKINANAYVLIGGSSKRFGSPKWEAKLNGVRLIDHTWEICKIFESCTIVGKSKNNEIRYPFLKDKIDQQIFTSSINIFDKPDLVKGMGSQCFDSEGVKSQALKLVERGFLREYLVDTYNGKKLNLKSNGRSGGSTNLYFENGKISYDDLLKSHSKILYVTETIGHGTNLVTGDYSVGATGFLVENGEFKYPVNEITIAGNFNEMFKNITLANDLEFKYSVNSPTMMIDGMTVAGK